MSVRKKIGLYTGLVLVGGILYTAIELLWRGRTHISMFPVGGVCFVLIGGIHRRFTRLAAIWRCGICAAAVTGVELVSGYILNVWWRLGVWDYSGQPLNIGGQVCLLYTGFWMVLSWVARPVYEGCRRLISRGLDTPSLGGNSRT